MNLIKEFYKIDESISDLAYAHNLSKNEVIRNPFLLNTVRANIVFELLEQRLDILNKMKENNKKNLENIKNKNVICISKFKQAKEVYGFEWNKV